MSEYQEVYREHNLSDVVDLKHGYQFRDEDFVEEGIPVIKISNVKGTGLDTKSVTYVSWNRLEEFESVVIKNNDILMSLTGNIGRVVVVSGLKGPVFQNYRVGKFEPLSESLDKGFLACLLSSESLFDQLEQYSNQSAQANFGKQDLDKLKVIIPETISTQQKIAKILSTVDNLIEKTQALIDKYTAIKQGMMADLFTRGIDMTTGDTSNSKGGKLRPSVEDAPELYKQTELGWVPKEWEVRSIEDVSLGGFKNGYFKDPKLVGSGMKLINVSELYQDYGIDITTEKVERIKVSRKDYEKYKVELGDIFFTRSSLVLEGIAKSNIVRVLPEKAVFECHVMRLKPDQSQVAPEFLAIYTGMSAARSYLMSMAKQVTMTTIAQPDMVGLPVPVPPLGEQEKVIQQLNSIEELIVKETAEMKKNKAIKKGLMQDLLTGKVKVQ